MTQHVARELLEAACGSRRWVELVLERSPLDSGSTLHRAADEAFDRLAEDDWLEAFAAHPRIGDVRALRERFAASGALSEREQAGLLAASDEQVLESIARNNAAYEQQHGFVFLVRAAGRTAHEILELQRQRLANDRQAELAEAARQQREITHLRLDAAIDQGPRPRT